MKRRFRLSSLLAVALLISFTISMLVVRPASAHTRVEIGPYVIIIGWETEPVVVGERNAVFFEVSKDGQPVEGLESTLEAVVLYGGQTFTGNLEPGAEPGIYTVEIMPTVRGQYAVQLAGAIEELEVSEIVEPEEVLPARVLQFPESPPDSRELQAAIDDLSAQLQTARILAIVGVALGILGIGAAAVSLARSRR